jgi:hypothetical protein
MSRWGPRPEWGYDGLYAGVGFVSGRLCEGQVGEVLSSTRGSHGPIRGPIRILVVTRTSPSRHKRTTSGEESGHRRAMPSNSEGGTSTVLACRNHLVNFASKK